MTKKIKLFLASASTSVLMLPISFASAQTGFAKGDSTGQGLGILMTNILTFTNTVLVPFILGIGFLVFVWGMFQFFVAGGANDEAKQKGKSLMIYAVLGFVMIMIFFGVINLLVGTTGLDEQLKVPTPQAGKFTL